MNEQNTNKEILVNKLQGALAKFRNERDQLHRSKRLALERCRLMQAEEEALSKTVQTLRNKYEVLVASTTKIESELGPLEQQVQQDTKQVRFCERCMLHPSSFLHTTHFRFTALL
jgi:chromosome segregation ATPase